MANKPAKNAPKAQTHRQERAARAANADRDAKPENESLEGMIGRWRELHIVAKRTEVQIETVKRDVKASMVALGVNHVSTPFGTPTLIARAGATRIDWESLARANVDKDVIERELPRYTSTGEPTTVLEADRSWTLAAKQSTSPG